MAKSYICPACMKDNYRYLEGTDCLLRQGMDKPTCCMLNVVVKQLELPLEVRKLETILRPSKVMKEARDGEAGIKVHLREGD